MNIMLTAVVGTSMTAATLACGPCDEPVIPAPALSDQAPIAMIAQEMQPKAVDLVICLDTSGSMRGLIDAAKQKLWAIVSDLALAEPAPQLRVALLTFGNDGDNAEDGWVSVKSDLTTDLDMVSSHLFALSTNGGTELVGRVIDKALTDLTWAEGEESLKLLIVAGNESADQDQVTNYRDVCKAAISQGVMINSIYCGNPADEIAPGWQDVSRLADGHYAAIDQNNGTVVITTPFDAELSSLSAAVNRTYIPFGQKGEWYAGNQVAQDNNASGLNSAASASRAMAKCQTVYSNSNWDLVDACSGKDFKLEEVKAEDLPEAMREMTVEEQRAYIAGRAAERKKIQDQVTALNAKRTAYIDVEMKKQGLDESTAFDAAIRRAIREQASSKGFRWAEPKVAKPTDVGEAAEAETTTTVMNDDGC